MILEIADIRIPPGQQAAFDEAIQRGIATVASKAKGFRGFKVNKGIESPERYVLKIFWDDARGPHGRLSPGPAVRAVARHRRAVLRAAAAGGALRPCWPSRTDTAGGRHAHARRSAGRRRARLRQRRLPARRWRGASPFRTESQNPERAAALQRVPERRDRAVAGRARLRARRCSTTRCRASSPFLIGRRTRTRRCRPCWCTATATWCAARAELDATAATRGRWTRRRRALLRPRHRRQQGPAQHQHRRAGAGAGGARRPARLQREVAASRPARRPARRAWPSSAARSSDALRADVLIASDGPRLRVDRPDGLPRHARRRQLRPDAEAARRRPPLGQLGRPAAQPGHRAGAMRSPAWSTRAARILVEALRPPPIPANVRAALADIEVGGDADDPEIDADWGEPGLTPTERVIGWNTLEVLAIGVGNARLPGQRHPAEARRRRCSCASSSAPTADAPARARARAPGSSTASATSRSASRW